jgi:thiaminase II
MVSASGHRLIDDAAAACLKDSLLPLADICTPNLPEAEALLGRRIAAGADDAEVTIEAMHVAAGDLAAQTGCRYVLIKGGHAANLDVSAAAPAGASSSSEAKFAVDVLLHAASGRWWTIRSPVIRTRNTHGTGCTLASAIATGLARGRGMLSAVLSARRYLAEALHRSRSLAIGRGEHGPINHTFAVADWTSTAAGHPAGGAGTASAGLCELRVPARVAGSLRLNVVTDPGFLAARATTLADAVVAAVRGGATLVQLRDKHADTATFVREARGAIAAIRALGATLRVPVLINDRIDVALAVDADGVHVGQSDMPVAMARKLLGPSKMIGTTVSTPEQARQAVADGADYLGTDPVFSTSTKTDSPELGLSGFKAIVDAVRGTPVVAIGGIKLENAADVLRESGAAGIAVVSAVFNQPDMQASAQELRDAVDGALASAPAAAAPTAAAEDESKEEFFVGDFAKACITAAGSAWSGSFEHPFVLALADGTLSGDKFRFYQMQDARYLESFADACSLIAARCHDPEDKLWFIQAGVMALEVERSLHLDYGQRLGYGPADIAATELTPNGKAYADHMVQAATRGSLVEAVAALTPCPWLYIDLGRHLLRERGAVADDHPYAAWLRLYSDSGFLDYMDNLLRRLQKFADESGPSTRERAKHAFVLSARYEYMFWDQAWLEQTWPSP